MSEAFEFTQQPEEQPVPQPQEGPENGTAPEGENAPEEQEKKPPEDVFYWLNALTTALVCLVIVFTFRPGVPGDRVHLLWAAHPGGRALYGEHPARRAAAAGPVPGL